MGLSHYKPKRVYPADAVIDKLESLYDDWYQNTPADEIRRDHRYWNLIHDDIIYQVQGEILGTLSALETLRFCDRLAFHENRRLKIASLLLCRPTHEDLLRFDGLKSIVEDFYLKTYGVAPLISETCWNPYRAEIAVATRSRLNQLITGHPSPKRIIRDWKLATSDIYCLEFNTRIRGSDLIFSVVCPTSEPNKADVDTDFINDALSAIHSIRGTV